MNPGDSHVCVIFLPVEGFFTTKSQIFWSRNSVHPSHPETSQRSIRRVGDSCTKGCFECSSWRRGLVQGRRGGNHIGYCTQSCPYMKSIEIVWDLDFLLFFRASILCTPWPHPFICYVQDPSNTFQFALLGQVYPDIIKLSSTEMDIYPSFYAQGVASQPQTLRHRVAKTLARSGSSREVLWRSSPGGWVQTVGFASGNSTGTMTLLDIVGLQTVYI